MRSLIFLGTAALLVACGDTFSSPPDGGGIEGDGGGDAGRIVVPTELSQNLSTFQFADDMETVTVHMTGLDTTPVEAVYRRDRGAEAALGHSDYYAFSAQEDPLDRIFLALGSVSADGKTRALVVGDGGQFNKVFHGAQYERIGDFDPPEVGTGPGAGQVSYAGNYAAVTNVSVVPGASPSVDVSLLPGAPGIIRGDIFLNADFADNAVNGAIYRRVLVNSDDPSTSMDVGSVALIVSDIGAEGTFFGDVEVSGDVGNVIGSYGGIFGGKDASSVAGIARFDGLGMDIEDTFETGIFVLTQCGKNGDDGNICDFVEP